MSEWKSETCETCDYRKGPDCAFGPPTVRPPETVCPNSMDCWPIVQEVDDCCVLGKVVFVDEWHDACYQWRREET